MREPSDTPTPATPSPSTLDDIFCIHARARPEALALSDPPDRATFTDGAPRQLTYVELNRTLTAIASRLGELDLPLGAAVGLQMPNTAESVIAFLAVLRAGLVPVPLPLLWRRAELVRALERVGARALISCGRVMKADHVDLALHVAAETFSIRYVCGFGAALPDGVVPLGDIAALSASEVSDLQASAGPNTTGVAVITFDTGDDGPVPVPRTQAELLAGGFAVVLEAGFSPHGAVLGPMLLSSFPVLATTLIPWLLTGGTLHLHQPFDEAVFARQVANNKYDAIILPGPLVPALATSDGTNAKAARTLALWRAPERQRMSPPWLGDGPLIDILAFGELGIVPLRRVRGEAAPNMTIGTVLAPAGAPDGTVIATLSCGAKATLMLGGPIVPRHIRLAGGAQPSSAVDTGYACGIDATTNAVILGARPPGLIGIGGYRFAMSELQELVGRLDPDGVVAALPDLLAGEKLAGAAADPALMRSRLAALGINPLLAEAFRDPAPVAHTSAA